MQGPFRVPSFNSYVPRRLQPWIYICFAFIFLMSGGIYGGAMSQVMGEYSLMREDVLMIIMFNVVGVAMPFPFPDFDIFFNSGKVISDFQTVS